MSYELCLKFAHLRMDLNPPKGVCGVEESCAVTKTLLQLRKIEQEIDKAERNIPLKPRV